MLRKTKNVAAPAEVKVEKTAAVEIKAEKTAPVVEKAAAEVKAAPEVKAPKAAVKAPKVKAEKAPKVKVEKAPRVKAEKAPAAAKVTEEVYLQYNGAERALADLKKKAQDAYVAEGHSAASIKKVALYVKPEERKAYYVINDESTGSVEL